MEKSIDELVKQIGQCEEREIAKCYIDSVYFRGYSLIVDIVPGGEEELSEEIGKKGNILTKMRHTVAPPQSPLIKESYNFQKFIHISHLIYQSGKEELTLPYLANDLIQAIFNTGLLSQNETLRYFDMGYEERFEDEGFLFLDNNDLMINLGELGLFDLNKRDQIELVIIPYDTEIMDTKNFLKAYAVNIQSIAKVVNGE